jgi:hypothetical protein
MKKDIYKYFIKLALKGKYLKLRNKKDLRDYIKKNYPNTPEYVLEDIIRNSRDSLYNINAPGDVGSHPYETRMSLKAVLADTGWSLEILDLAFEDFDPDTCRRFLERKFGDVNPYEIPNDEKRMEFQKSNLIGNGNNEPIILIKKGSKYELLEGWHRTMTLLSRLPRDSSGKPEGKIKIKAWVSHKN